MNIVVTRGDSLRRQRWEFWFRVDYGMQAELVLDMYCEEHRESARKRTWETDRLYSRIDMRSYREEKKVSAEDVPIPPDVEGQVKREITDMVTGLEIRRGRA